MPLFYLELRQGNEDLPNDPEPQEFPDLESARIEAVKSIRQLLSPSDYDGIDILDHDRKQLLRVSTGEALGDSDPET